MTDIPHSSSDITAIFAKQYMKKNGIGKIGENKLHLKTKTVSIFKKSTFLSLLLLKENNCAKLFCNPSITIEVTARTSSIYDIFLNMTFSLTLLFNLTEQIFQMTLLLFKENNCAKLFRNPCINVQVMVQRDSIMTN